MWEKTRFSTSFSTLCRKNFKTQIQYLIKPVAAAAVLTFWQNTSDKKGLFFFRYESFLCLCTQKFCFRWSTVRIKSEKRWDLRKLHCCHQRLKSSHVIFKIKNVPFFWALYNGSLWLVNVLFWFVGAAILKASPTRENNKCPGLWFSNRESTQSFTHYFFIAIFLHLLAHCEITSKVKAGNWKGFFPFSESFKSKRLRRNGYWFFQCFIPIWIYSIYIFWKLTARKSAFTTGYP